MSNGLISELHFMVIGTNHRSSTMAFRDRLAVSDKQSPLFYRRVNEIGIGQALTIITNDRVEFCIWYNKIKDPSQEIIKLLSAHAGLSRSEIESQIYVLKNTEAAHHFLSVFCALDSLLIGDPQIGNAIRMSYQKATRMGLSGEDSGFLLERAELVSKRISAETDFGRRPCSIPSAIVQVAHDLFGNIAECSALLIGVGEMAELLATSLMSANLGNLIVTHSRIEASNSLGKQLNCHVEHIEKLNSLVINSDIILTSVNSRRYTVTYDLMLNAIQSRRRKPVLLVDAGVPGDAEPAVASIEDVFMFGLDDLERVTRDSNFEQTKEADKARLIITEEIKHISFGTLGDEILENHLTEGDPIEKMRKEAIEKSKGDADLATQLFLRALEKYHKTPKNINGL